MQISQDLLVTSLMMSSKLTFSLFLGGLQPLHYKQLLALYTDVKNLDDAEEEVDGKL